MAFIYGLADPITNELRYVGRTTKSLDERYRIHLACLEYGQLSHKRNWIKSLQAKGYQPEIFVIEEISVEECNEAEIGWIAYFKSIGCRLTNLTAGGDGCLNATPELRELMSSKRKGRVVSEETRGKISRAHLGMKHSEETKKRIGEKSKGKIIGEAQRIAVGLANRNKKGKALSKAHRLALSESYRRRVEARKVVFQTSLDTGEKV